MTSDAMDKAKGSFESGAHGTRERSYRNLSQSSRMKHGPAGQAGQVIAPGAASYREAIAAQLCPFCEAGPFKMLAGHVNKSHGIDRHEFRKLAGLKRSDTICSPEVHELCGELYASRDDPPRSPGRTGRLSSEQLAQICLWYKGGASARWIAKNVGMEKTRILRILKGQGVPMRPAGGSPQKLSQSQVIEIRRRRHVSTKNQLAKEYGVSSGLISMIWNRRAWKDIP